MQEETDPPSKRFPYSFQAYLAAMNVGKPDIMINIQGITALFQGTYFLRKEVAFLRKVIDEKIEDLMDDGPPYKAGICRLLRKLLEVAERNVIEEVSEDAAAG